MSENVSYTGSNPAATTAVAPAPRRRIKPWWIILGLVVLLVIWAIGQYNGMVSSKGAVDKAWSNVEVTYQRRADLIPNLVNTVKGYAKHEQDTLQKLTEARSAFKNAKSPDDYVKANNDLKAAINVVVEAYPDLKANQNFLNLQDQLEGTENRIAVARRDYNAVATNYNISVKRFPRSIFAGIFGFKPVELFQADPGSKDAPKVNF